MVEDCFRSMRFCEGYDTTNKVKSVVNYYAAMGEMGCIAEHNRQEIKPDDDDPKQKATPRLCSRASIMYRP